MTNHRNDSNKKMNPGETGNLGHTTSQHSPTEPQGLKRRHFMGTALALDAAALLAACGGGGGGGDAATGSGSGSGSGSGGSTPTQWIVSTLAGTGANTPYTDGTGGTATFYSPNGVAVDGSGNVYVADYNNHLIRKISNAGMVSTLAGVMGSTGSANGTGGSATFNNPAGVALDLSGNLYVADKSSNQIRKITPAGVVTTLAGSGVLGNDNGTGETAKFGSPTGVALDTDGNVYVADRSNHRIRKITPSGVVSTLAGTGAWGTTDGTGETANFFHPHSVAVDSSGNVYVADSSNCLIRKISPTRVTSTLAGLGSSTSYRDGTGGTALFYNPTGVALDNSGNLYVTDNNNHLIRKINPAGEVSTLAGSLASGTANGIGTGAQFNNPTGIALDASGNLYVADQSNNRIRKITPI